MTTETANSTNPDSDSSKVQFWESRYQSRDTPWNKGEPSPGLVQFLKTHKPTPGASVLVPGCGFGYDTIPWAEAGCVVTGMDLSPTAAENASKTHQHPSVKFVAGNFLEFPPRAQFDWVFEHTLYCALPPSCRTDHAKACATALRKGGSLLAIHYLIPDKSGPPFGTTRDEVFDRFSTHFDLLDEWLPASYPHRAGLERMFWWRVKDSYSNP